MWSICCLMVGPLSSHILVKCYTVTPSIAITVFRKKKKKKQNTQDNFGHKVWCDCPASCYYENICKFTRRLLWLVAQLLDWQQLIVPPKEFMVSSRQKLLTFSVFLQYIVKTCGSIKRCMEATKCVCNSSLQKIKCWKLMSESIILACFLPRRAC